MNSMLKNALYNIIEGRVNKNQIENFLSEYYYGYLTMMGTQESKDTFPKEVSLPLEKRTSGVLEALTKMVNLGFDLNEGHDNTPLMLSVENADAPITEFLIKHGANPKYWIGIEAETDDKITNYYYEDIDIACVYECWPGNEEYANALLNTAKVLAESGKIGSFRGTCLMVDADTGVISLRGPHMRY